MLMVDASGTHLFYVDEFFQTAVAQKPTAAPTLDFAQGDINATWSGDSVTTAEVTRSDATPPGTGFGTLTPASSTTACQAAAASAPEGPSSCTITTGSTVRTAAAMKLTGKSDSRWNSTYTITPADKSGPDNATNLYLTPDKTYAGGFACGTILDFKTCEFYSLSKQ